MAIVFPASPSTNDTFTAGSITYKWDGAKWIGLGITPADRLVEGSNKLEIDGSNNLIWTGNNVGIGQGSPQGDLHIGNINGSKNLIMHGANNGDATIRFREGGSNTAGFNEYSIGMDGSRNAIVVNGQGAGEIIAIKGDTGNVGINSPNPGSKLHIIDTMQATANGHVQVSILGDDGGTNGESSAIYMSAINASNRGIKIVSEKQSSSNNHDLIFQTSSVSDIPTEKLRITSDGEVQIANGNLKFSTAGTGIDFSANANAAGMTSEVLDDYEEGTWTPTWGSTTGSFTSVTYTIQSGRYTKIGNRVFIDCKLRSSATTLGTAGGALMVTGLPFTCTTSQGTGGAASYSMFDFSNSGLFFGTETRENTTQFFAAIGTRDNGTFFNEGPGSLQGSGNSEIRVQFCYKTDD